MGLWRRRGGALLALAILVVPLLGLAASSPSAAAASIPFGAPTLVGAVILDGGAALALMGYSGWFGAWTPTQNSTDIYSTQFYIIFFNLRTVGFNVSINVTQNGQVVSLTSVYLPPISEEAQTVNVPPSTSWTPTKVLLADTPAWYGRMSTPLSFLPLSVIQVGGLDLLGLLTASFMLFVGAAGIGAAHLVMRRAVWSKRFSLLWWGHVVIAFIASVVLFDYQQINALFAGWAPLVYPWAFFPLFFFSSLYRFNRAPQVEVLQGIAPPSGEFAFRRTKMRVGPLEDGRVVAIDETWGGLMARYFGHHAVVWDGSDQSVPPFLAPVEHGLSPTEPPTRRLKALRARRKYPLSAHPLFRFAVQNPQDDDVGYIALARTGASMALRFPYLTFHREVTLPAEYAVAPDGTTYEAVAAQTRRKLSWPHYVEPTNTLGTDFLLDKHFVYGALAWMEFSTIQDLSRIISKQGTELAVLKAGIHDKIQDEIYSKLRIIYSLTGRATSGITDEEAAAMARDMERLVRGRTEREP